MRPRLLRGQGLARGHGLRRQSLATLPVPAAIPTIPRRALSAGHVIDVLVMLLQEIRDVEECVALQAKVHKSGLHAGEHASHAPLVDTARERILVGALEVHLHQLIVFEKRHSGLMPVGRDHHLLAHSSLLRRVLGRGPDPERDAKRERNRTAWFGGRAAGDPARSGVLTLELDHTPAGL